MSVANIIIDELAREPIADKLNRWLDIINDCCEAVETLAEQYPAEWQSKLDAYNNMIDEIYFAMENFYTPKGKK